MTTLTQNVTDIAGVADDDVWIFFADEVRLSPSGFGIISTKQRRVMPVNGVLTVDLAPGPAVVSFAGEVYRFTVPDTDSEIWPLIQGTAPDPPPPPPPGTYMTLTDDGTGLLTIGTGDVGVSLTDDGTGLLTISSPGTATLTDDGTGLLTIG